MKGRMEEEEGSDEINKRKIEENGSLVRELGN